MNAVWASGLRKRYRKRTAVDGVSFSVARGEVLGLLGPNGAGQDHGHQDDARPGPPGRGRGDAPRPARSKIRRPAPRSATCPNSSRYQPWLTAKEVLDLHVRLAGAAVPEKERRDTLGLVGLGERTGDRVGGFSKGMQQRLGLAVALVARPEFVVLDEPTSALDPVGRADVRDIVLSLKERGVAVLLNSHLIGEVERVCDRVVILDKGRVAASGTLEELLGSSEVRLRLEKLTPEAEARLAQAGPVSRDGDVVAVALTEPGVDLIPDLVADLVALGVRVHCGRTRPHQP